MSTEEIVVNRDRRGVLTLTLHRPEVNNAYNKAMLDRLDAALVDAAQDAAVRAVVVRGAGRHFQAGADLTEMRALSTAGEAANLAMSAATAGAFRRLNLLLKPTVALVHGACFGGGVGIAVYCDIVIASTDAFFSIAEGRWGLAVGPMAVQLNAAIGARQARRYVLSGERFAAEQAHAIGLVHALCPPGALEESAAPIIDSLLQTGPDALAKSKRSILDKAGMLIDEEEFQALVKAHAAKRQSAEAAEGLASFVEKRRPAWYPG